MAGLTSVQNLEMGDAIGTAKRTLYVVISPAERTAYGTICATVAYPLEESEGITLDEVRTERREWLHGADARVHVREREA